MIKKRFKALKPHLDERMRRLVAAAEAQALGHGGISAVSRATGLSRNTVARGMEELDSLPAPSAQRTRRRGGGRKREIEKDPTLIRDLECLMEPLVRGEPVSSMQWTCKGLRRLANELKAQGHTTSHRMVGELLHRMGYRFQVQTQAQGGLSRLERHAWFERIHQSIEGFHRKRLPVISVEMKKRERLNRGRGRIHGSPSQEMPGRPAPPLLEAPETGEARREILPHANRFSGYLPLKADHTTCAIAAESIRRWWLCMGDLLYPEADALLVTADGAGDSRYRIGPWKEKLQAFADESELSLTVLRFPAGMCKWNRIEDRYVSCVRQEWPQGPCIEHEVIVNVIAGANPGIRLQESPCPPGSRVLPDEGNRPENGTKAPILPNEDEYGAWGFTLVPSPRKTP